MSRWLFAAIATVASAVVSLLPLGGAAPAGACRSVGGSIQVRTSDGVRTALLQVPVRASGRAPLVLAFHGTGSNGPSMKGYSGLGELAEREGFVVAYPTSERDPDQWSLGEDTRGDDDLELVDKVIARLVESGCADPARVYAVGVSNGGRFATRLACDRSDRIAAVVSVAGADGVAKCTPDRPVSLLEIHGTADQVVPYSVVMPWVRAWARRDGCPQAFRRQARGPRLLQLSWGPCREGTEVVHLRIDAGRHQWPGASPPDPGPASPLSAAEEAWRFLRTKRLAADPHRLPPNTMPTPRSSAPIASARRWSYANPPPSSRPPRRSARGQPRSRAGRRPAHLEPPRLRTLPHLPLGDRPAHPAVTS
jgi:polyhydroxybutyrate depolymerase